MRQDNGLSIVLPCYNPPNGWDAVVIDAVKKINQALAQEVQLIIVNDGSTLPVQTAIDTIKNVFPSAIYLHYHENKGKGYALRKGVEVATQPLIIYTDIDFPYDIPSVLRIFEFLCEGYDVVVGTKGAAYYTHTPWARKVISKILRRGISLLLKMPITDTQAGLKGFNQQGRLVFLGTTINRYLFDLEFVYQSFRTRPSLRIIASPSSLRPGVIFRKMNMSILKDEAFNFLRILLK